MQKTLLILVCLISFLAVSPFAAANELRVFIWSEYMDEVSMPAEFKKLTGIQVRLDFYESNEEMTAKLQTGRVGQYDIVVPSDFIMPSLINLKLLQPLNHALIPNLENLATKFRTIAFDPGNRYSAGYQWGTIGLMYRKDRLSAADVATWAILFDEHKTPGAFYLLDSVREMLGITLLYLGYDFNTIIPQELKAAADLLIKTKKRRECLGFKGGVGGKNDVIAGVANAAIVYSGDAMQAMAEDPEKIGFIVPGEGSEIWIDAMAIPAKAPNPVGAHKWINWILDATVGASLSNYNHNATPNQAARPFLLKADLENPGIWPPPEKMKILHFAKDLGKDSRIVDEAWTMIKSQ